MIKTYIKFIMVLTGFLFSLNVRSQQLDNEQNQEIKLGKLSEGFRTFSQNGKMGIMDKDGHILLQPVFYLPEDLENSLPVFKQSRCIFLKTK